MAEIPAAARLIIDQFLSELAANDITIEQAILFGSYAKGTFDEWSDIDLALVSRDRDQSPLIMLFARSSAACSLGRANPSRSHGAATIGAC